jgi:hypothetical protein
VGGRVQHGGAERFHVDGRARRDMGREANSEAGARLSWDWRALLEIKESIVSDRPSMTWRFSDAKSREILELRAGLRTAREAGQFSTLTSDAAASP